jgi:MFS transporter, ACDE family, multidrug resistance protein
VNPLSKLRQYPPAVLATALATFMAFLGLGVVDPILPTIAGSMGASHFMVELLFTSYLLVMALAMLVSGALATRIGSKNTLVLGLGLVAVFAGLCGLAPSIEALAILRGGWGLGNAFFTTTALAIIVGSSAGRTAGAITLFEASLGLGIATGPLLGGFLGSLSWRFPFFGTALLTAVGFVLALVAIPDSGETDRNQSIADVLGAFRHTGVQTNAVVGLLYSIGFFTVLAYAPLVLGLSATALGLTFFAWGTLVAICSVIVAPRLTARFGAVTTLVGDLIGFTILLAAMSLVNGPALVAGVIISGTFCGIANATLTTLAMEVSSHSRPVSSAAFNALRFGGAAIAPISAGYIGSNYGATTPFLIGAVIVAIGIAGLFWRREIVNAGLSTSAPASAD